MYDTDRFLRKSPANAKWEEASRVRHQANNNIRKIRNEIFPLLLPESRQSISNDRSKSLLVERDYRKIVEGIVDRVLSVVKPIEEVSPSSPRVSKTNFLKQ